MSDPLDTTPCSRAPASSTNGTFASLRGRVFSYEGVPLIVTYHPAYLLRNLPDKSKAWADLVFARKTMANL